MRRRDLVRAGWPHGAIVRANTLDVYSARLRKKLRHSRRRARDRDAPRGRLPDRMSRLGIRRKLLLVVIARLQPPRPTSIVGFNLLLESARPERHRSLCDRVPGAGGVASAGNGRLVSARPPTRLPGHLRLGLDGRPYARGARAYPRVTGRPAGCRAGRGFHLGGTRLYAAPCRRRQSRSAPLSPASRSTPTRSTQHGARRLGCLRRPRRSAARRCRPVASWRLAAAGDPHDPAGGRLERADLDHRFGLGEPHDELTELAVYPRRTPRPTRRQPTTGAAFLRGALARAATPLAKIVAEADSRYAASVTRATTGTLEPVQRNAGQLARTVDTLVAAARYETGIAHGTSDAELRPPSAVDRAGPRLGAGRRVVSRPAPAPDPPRGRRELATRILQPSSRTPAAMRHGRISLAGTAGSAVVYTIDDDGPGVADGERDRSSSPASAGSAESRWVPAPASALRSHAGWLAASTVTSTLPRRRASAASAFGFRRAWVESADEAPRRRRTPGLRRRNRHRGGGDRLSRRTIVLGRSAEGRRIVRGRRAH